MFNKQNVKMKIERKLMLTGGFDTYYTVEHLVCINNISYTQGRTLILSVAMYIMTFLSV